jgi:hypothetical protein
MHSIQGVRQKTCETEAKYLRRMLTKNQVAQFAYSKALRQILFHFLSNS